MITPYTVDLTPNRGTPAVVHVSQDDIKRLLVFKVVDDAGTDWAETNCSFTLRGRKPSKLGFQVDGTVEAGDTGTVIKFYTTRNMTSEAGQIPAEIRVRDEDTGTVLGTANLILDVEKNPHPAGTTDGSQPEAKTLMEAAEAYLAQTRQAAAEAAASAESADASADLAEQYKDAAFSGTPEGYEALAAKMQDVPGDIETRQDILRRKVLALTAGVKEMNRWALRTYYEVTSIEDNLVRCRFAGRSVSFNINAETPGSYGLVTRLYGYGFRLTDFYRTLVTDSTTETHFYFDGRPKDTAAISVGDVFSTLTMWKQLMSGRYLVIKLDSTGLHVWMLYNYKPSALSTLVNESAEDPNFTSVFRQEAGDCVEVTEIATERSLVTVQSATWTANEWHRVDVFW